MNIRHWPAAERPRERLLAHGASRLSNAELLAIFLRSGRRGHSALDLARDLLLEFGSLRGLFTADPRRLCGSAGLGPAMYCLLQASVELNQRLFAEELKTGGALESPTAAKAYFRSRLRHRRREIFACLYLDNRHRVLDYQEPFLGTINGAPVYPREIVRQALERNAAALLVAHNHPSGVSEPSEADRQITRRLEAALALIDVRLLDHLVIGDGDIVSFSERGFLSGSG